MSKKVLFICLGNICRSPIAEAVFMDLVKKRGLADRWNIDSAGIGDWHKGKRPDVRAREVLLDNNLEYHNRARQIKESDFEEFDYIFGMDYENMDDLKRLAPSQSRAQLLLLGDFDPKGEKVIRDPFYDRSSEGFVKCYEQCVRCCAEFIDKHSM